MDIVEPAGYVIDLFGTIVAGFPEEAYESHLRQMARCLEIDGHAFAANWLGDTPSAMIGRYRTVAERIDATGRASGATRPRSAILGAERAYMRFVRETLAPRPDVLPTLARLKARGARICLLSNCAPEVPALWASTPFAHIFDVAVFSCAEQLAKPDRALFLRAATRLGLDAGEILFVSDGGLDELEAARDVGMEACLFDAEDLCPDRLQGGRWNGARIERFAHLAEVGGAGRATGRGLGQQTAP